MEKTENFKKNFIWNIIGTTFNSFNSLFFLIIVTRMNGTENAGIFSLAFSTACILYIIGVYAGRIFQVTENQKVNDKEYLVNRMITVGVMLLISIGFVLIKGYDLYKASIFLILCFYKACEAFSDVVFGILQKKDLLHKVGKSFFIKAIISLIAFILCDIVTKNLLISCTCIVVSNLLGIIFYDIPSVSKVLDKQEKVEMRNVWQITKSGVFVFAISFLGMYIMNAPKYSIDNYLNEHIQAIYGIIVMPATAIGLFSQFIIHPYLNTVADRYRNYDIQGMKKIMVRLIAMVAGVGIFSAIVAYLLGIPVLQLIYGVELQAYQMNLVWIIIASTFNVIAVIYSSILTTIRKTFIQFVIYVVVSIFAISFSNFITKTLEINGATIAYFGIMFLQFLLYAIITAMILKKLQDKLVSQKRKEGETD